MSTLLHYLISQALLEGLRTTLFIAAVSSIFAFPLALAVALLRNSSVRVVSSIVGTYQWVVRGVPLLVQLLFFYNGLPSLGIKLDPIQTGILTLTLYEAAFSGEIIRGGFNAVKSNQIEAAKSLGMGRWMTLKEIRLPQMVRVILPAIGNRGIYMIKNTSLMSVIAVSELTLRAGELTSATFQYIPAYGAAAILYLLSTSVIEYLQRRTETYLSLEQRARRRDASRKAAAGAVGEPTGSERAGAIGKAANLGINSVAGEAGDLTGELVVDNIRKQFSNKVVLDGVSFRLGHGTVMCILGSSGGGKSTLLRIVAGLIPADEGKVEFESRAGGTMSRNAEQGSRLSRGQRNFGIVFQQFNLFEHMTVLQNITEAPVLVNKETAEEAVAHAHRLLQLVGLSGYEDKYPFELSGGQQQRVAIARALAMRPKVLLLDEPTSALDPELTAEVLDTMRLLAKSGMTMVVATHEINFARQCADVVLFMDHGAVVERGPPEDVIDSPKNTRLRRFLQTA